jgi:hypothetical protein
MYRGGWAPNASISLSAQTWAPRLSLCAGLTDDLEMGLSLGGYGLGRSLKNPGDLRVHVGYEGVTAVDLREESWGGSNPRLRLRVSLLQQKNPSVPKLTLGCLLTFPAASDRSFARPGGPEFGLSLDASWDLLSPFILHLTAETVLEGELAGLESGEGIRTSPLFFGAVGLELRLWEVLTAHLQLELLRNPFPRTRNYRFDHHPFQVTAGLRLQPRPDLALFLTFSEDLSRTAPDFGVGIGVELRH